MGEKKEKKTFECFLLSVPGFFGVKIHKKALMSHEGLSKKTTKKAIKSPSKRRIVEKSTVKIKLNLNFLILIIRIFEQRYNFELDFNFLFFIGKKDGETFLNFFSLKSKHLKFSFIQFFFFFD